MIRIAMEGKRLIQRLTLRNFLSYGSEGASIDLLPLNVLIGPNASGKSNLIEALAVLRAATSDLAGWIREGGGIGEYIWKGEESKDSASIHSFVDYPYADFVGEPLHHGLSLARSGPRLEVAGEVIERETFWQQPGALEVPGVTFYLLDERRAYLASSERDLRREDLIADQSILSQRRDPDRYPALTYLADQFARIAIYQEWTFGRRTRARAPEPTDLPTDFLRPDGSNLALVLHEMQQRSQTRRTLIEYLRRFYQSAQHVATPIQGGTVQLLIEESGGEVIPATRLSDGTLRYLSLLAILLHPSPPPLVCIEEPELGLHPDIMPTIAELLRDASQRTQLVVTTHSDALVSALSDVPESIVVCESTVRGTELRRLDPEDLTEWLNKYSLGELWRIGGIGGTRW